jgi:hypothetical protein
MYRKTIEEWKAKMVMIKAKGTGGSTIKFGLLELYINFNTVRASTSVSVNETISDLERRDI